MVYGEEGKIVSSAKPIKVEVTRGKTTDTIWAHIAVFDDRSEICLDWGSPDPWHDEKHMYQTQTDDKLKIYTHDNPIEITLSDSSYKMMVYDTMTREYLYRLREQYNK